MPNDYISREKAMRIFPKLGLTFDQMAMGADALNAIPAAPVAEVVRCKDCDYSNLASLSPNGRYTVCRRRYSVTVAVDHFCGYGEPRNGGERNAE